MSISVGQVKGNPKEAVELIGVLEAEIERLRAALKEIASGSIIQGMTPMFFAEHVLQQQPPVPK